MCGRLNVTDSTTTQWISTYLGIEFTTEMNADLRPTQWVSAIASDGNVLRQLNMSWGIKPLWSKKLLINARGETAATTKTFKREFRQQRCIVPCTGWYEWKDEGGPRKQKYLFTNTHEIPFLMGGIWFDDNEVQQLVTLTTYPNDRCAEIHNRMPVIIIPELIDVWFYGSESEVQRLIEPVDSESIRIEKNN